MEPNKDNIRLWIHALESREYQQTIGCLHRENPIEDDKPEDCIPAGHCCMGVLNEVAIKAGLSIQKTLEHDGSYYRYKVAGSGSVVYPDVSVWNWIGLPDCGGGGPEVLDPMSPQPSLVSFVTMNDQRGYDFKTIAKALRISYGIDD